MTDKPISRRGGSRHGTTQAPAPVRVPAETPARTEPLVWRQAGVWVTTPGNFNAEQRAHATACGFKWFAQEFDAPVAWVVGSAYPYADANAAIQHVTLDVSHAVISNDEDIYERENRGRSEQFVERFRGTCPDTPLLLAGNGYGGEGGVRDMDYRAWQAAHASFAPEAYANVYPQLSVKNCVLHALRAGWLIEQVHPMLGTYDSDAEGGKITPDIVAQYIADMHDYGVRGFSVYVGDQTPAWVFEQLGRAISDLGLAA